MAIGLVVAVVGAGVGTGARTVATAAPPPIAVGEDVLALTIDTGTPIEFAFRHAHPERLNQRWLQVMMDAVNSPRGLVLMTEDEAMRVAPRRRMSRRADGLAGRDQPLRS